MLGKKSLLVLSILSFSVSAVAFADTGTSTDDNSLKLSIPDLTTGWNFNIAALALKPAASNLNYAIYNRAGDPAITPIWQEEEISPSYSPAFEVGAGYTFSGGKDVLLDWTHLNSTTTTSVVAPNDAYFIGPDYQIGPDSIPAHEADGKAEFKYDVINLDAGQHLNFGRHTDIRFFGGLSTAFLREDVIATFTGNTVVGGDISHAGPFSMTSDNESDFKGIGPRLGLQLDYNTDYNVGFFGEAAGSALIGTSHTTANYTTSSADLQAEGMASNYQTISDQDVTQVIPGFDAKLGVNYKHAFSKNTVLTVSGGYEGAVYINAINQYKPQTLVKDYQDTGIYVDTMNHTQSNYSVQGPFLKFALQF